MTWAVVRVRGSVNVHPGTRDTLKMLRLNRVNHCVLVPEDEAARGMLRAAKDYVTWGVPSVDVVERLLAERARLDGGKPLTDDAVAERTPYGSLRELAEAVAADEVRLADLDGVKPVLRLHPPRQGYEGVKRSFKTGGALGDRGADIDALLERML